MKTWFRSALVLAAVLCTSAAARAADCFAFGSSQCFPTIVLIDPATGQPYKAGSNGSATNNTVAPTAAGTSATTANPVQGVTGGVPLAVSWAEQTVAVTGSVAVSNFPATQAVTWSNQTVAATQSGTWSVSVSNFPATQAVSIADGADATLGTKADAAATSGSTSASVVAWLRGLLTITGGSSDAAYTGTGPATTISALKGLYTATVGPFPASQAGPALGPAAALGVVQQDGITTTLSASAVGPLTNTTYTTGAIPTAGFASASVQITTSAATVIFYEGSNDGVTWFGVAANNSANIGASSPVISETTSGILRQISLTTTFIRIRTTTSGITASAIVVMKTTNVAPVATYATLSPAAATSANQNRLQSFSQAYAATVAANASTNPTGRTVGASAIFTKYNVSFFCTTAGTFLVQGSNDAFATTAYTLLTGTLTASTATSTNIPIVFTSYRAYVTNGATAGTCTIVDSFTAS